MEAIPRNDPPASRKRTREDAATPPTQGRVVRRRHGEQPQQQPHQLRSASSHPSTAQQGTKTNHGPRALATPHEVHDTALEQRLLAKERKLRVSPNSIARQPELDDVSRQMMVDAVVFACFHLQLGDECSHLSIQLIDRVLARLGVAERLVQSLTVCCIVLASKYLHGGAAVRVEAVEEILDLPPAKHEIVRLEIEVINALEFDLEFPTTLKFILMLTTQLELNHHSHVVNAAKYLAELALANPSISLSQPPSKLAVAALTCACNLLQVQLGETTRFGHSEDEVTALVLKLIEIATSADANTHMIFSKYSKPQHSSIAGVVANALNLPNSNSWRL